MVSFDLLKYNWKVWFHLFTIKFKTEYSLDIKWFIWMIYIYDGQCIIYVIKTFGSIYDRPL